MRIGYKHAFGKVVEYGVKRCFAFAQRLLRPLAFCNVTQD
jgi:hypothetical protein